MSVDLGLSRCKEGEGRGRGDWVLKDVLLQAKEIYALCENFMYTELPPVPSPCSCPCGCPGSCPLPLFLVPAGSLMIPSGLSGLSFMTVGLFKLNILIKPVSVVYSIVGWKSYIYIYQDPGRDLASIIWRNVIRLHASPRKVHSSRPHGPAENDLQEG